MVAAWQRSERRAPAEAWRIALQLLGTLHSAARIELLAPPPSRWGAAGGGPPPAGLLRAGRLRGTTARCA